jgi:hypothetical protein
MILNNIIPMLRLMDRRATMPLRGFKAIQVTGIKRHAGIPHSPMDFTTMDQTVPTFQACTDPLLRIGSLRMDLLRPLRLVVRSHLERDHIQQLSPNPPLPAQGHRLLRPFRASTLEYHYLCQRSLQTLQQRRPRSLESKISLGLRQHLSNTNQVRRMRMRKRNWPRRSSTVPVWYSLNTTGELQLCERLLRSLRGLQNGRIDIPPRRKLTLRRRKQRKRSGSGRK